MLVTSHEFRAILFSSLLLITYGFEMIRIVGDPKLTCSSSHAMLQFVSNFPFQGHIEVIGKKHDSRCRKDYTSNLARRAAFRFPLDTCCTLKQPKAATTVFSATVIVIFHPVVLTNSTRFFAVECEDSHDVRLPPPKIVQPLLSCIYEIRSMGKSKKPFVYEIGDILEHEWKCIPTNKNTSFVAIHVSTCDAINEDDNVLHLMDNSGCIIDSDIMENVDYANSGDLMAKTKSQMFKFLERKRFRISCRIEACERHQPYCLAKTPPRCAITKEEVQSKHYSPRSVSNTALPFDNHPQEVQWTTIPNQVTVISHWLVASSERLEWEIQHVKGKMLRATVDKDDGGNEQATGSQYEHLFFASTSRLDPRVPKDFRRKLEESSMTSLHGVGDENHHDDINLHDANLMDSTMNEKLLRVPHDGMILSEMTNNPQETESLDLSTIKPADFFFNKVVLTEEPNSNNHSTYSTDEESKLTSAVENTVPLTKFASQQIRPENGNNATDEEGKDHVDKISLQDGNTTVTTLGVESNISYKSDGDDAQPDGTAIMNEPKNESESNLASTTHDTTKYKDGSTESSSRLFFTDVANVTTRKLLHKTSAQIFPNLKKHQFDLTLQQLTTQSYENLTVINTFLKETTTADERKIELLSAANNFTTKQHPRASTVIPIKSSTQNSLPEHGYTLSNASSPGAEMNNLQSRVDATIPDNTTQMTSPWLVQPPLVSDKQKPFADFKDVAIESVTNDQSKLTLDEHDSSQSTGVVRLVSSEVSGIEHHWLSSGSVNERLSPSESLTPKRGETESGELDDEQPFLRSQPDLFSVTNFVQHTTKAMATIPLEPLQEIGHELEPFLLHAVPVLNTSQPAASAKLTTGKESDQTNISQTKQFFGEAVRKRANANISDSQHSANAFDETIGKYCKWSLWHHLLLWWSLGSLVVWVVLFGFRFHDSYTRSDELFENIENADRAQCPVTIRRPPHVRIATNSVR